jgi:hypothetical protein
MSYLVNFFRLLINNISQVVAVLITCFRILLGISEDFLKSLCNFFMYVIKRKSYGFSHAIWNKFELVSFQRAQIARASKLHSPYGLVQF